MGDSDDSYDFTQLGDFLAKLNEGYDLVMGNASMGKFAREPCPSCIVFSGILC